MRTPLVSTALLATSLLFAQNWTIEEVGTLPFKTANNAVTLDYTNGQPHIYSFCGIDSTLNRSGIHLQAGAVNIQTGESIQYADVESVKQQEILLYPNPTIGTLYLSQKRKVKVYTATGQLVYAGETKQINTLDWTSGLYTITVMQGDKKYTHSIIVSNEWQF